MSQREAREGGTHRVVADLKYDPIVAADCDEVLHVANKRNSDGTEAKKHEDDEEVVVCRAERVGHVRAVVIEDGDAALEYAAMLRAQGARDAASVAQRANL